MVSETLEKVRLELRKAVKFLNLSENVYEKLSSPDRLIETNLPVRMDNGEIKYYKAYRSQHDNTLGPYKGGIRFDNNTSKNDLVALSIWMTIKTAIVGVPFGGAKGLISVDAKKLSDNEKENLSREYVRSMYKYLGGNLDIPAPDINTDSKVMAKMLDEYEIITGMEDRSMITGKPVLLGGSKGRTEATGYGIAVIVEQVSKYLKSSKEVIVQGFGNVGSYTCKHLFDKGFKIIAISGRDKDGEYAIYNKNGLNIDTLIKNKDNGKELKDYLDKEIIKIDKFWQLKADVLIPAAVSNVIDDKKAKLINTPLIVEAANGPTTNEGDKILNEKGIKIIPDVLANAGGVIVSYFEWVQNNQGLYWSREEILEKEESIIIESFNNINNFRLDNNVSFRDSAYIYAVKKLYDALLLKGYV